MMYFVAESRGGFLFIFIVCEKRLFICCPVSGERKEKKRKKWCFVEQEQNNPPSTTELI